MVLAMIKHEVKDYSKWKEHFDMDRKNREMLGLKGKETVFRSVDDPNKVIVSMEWKNKDNFEKMMNSDELKKTLKEAGVLGQPSVMLYEKGRDALCECHVMK